MAFANGPGAIALSHKRVRAGMAVACGVLACFLAVASSSWAQATEVAEASVNAMPRRPTPVEAQLLAQRLGLGVVEREAPGIGGLEPGLYVQSASGPAREAGLRYGDRVLEINGRRVSGLEELGAALRSVGDGEDVIVLVVRGAMRERVRVVPRTGGASLPGGEG